MDGTERLLDSEKGALTDSTVKNSINLSFDSESGRFNSYTGSINSTSFIQQSKDGSQVLVHAYGATALSASGRTSNVILNEFDPFPVDVVCHNCSQAILTQIKYKPGKVTFIASAVIGLLTCGLGCFLIPFCVSVLKDVQHSCPNCGIVIGVYHRKLLGR